MQKQREFIGRVQDGKGAVTDTILQLYRKTGSIRKTADTLHITRRRVEKALDDAGIPRKKRSSKSICFDCANAFANKCAFMAADVDKAEAVLQETGAEYKSKICTCRDERGNTRSVPILTVLKCPEYREGDIVR